MTEQPVDQGYEVQDLPFSDIWLWNSQAPPPISGQVRSDSRDWQTANQVMVDRRTSAGTDMTASLAATKAGDWLRLQHNTDPTRYVTWQVLAPPARVAEYYQHPVKYLEGGGTLPNSGTQIRVSTLAAPSTSEVSVTFAQVSSAVWVGTATCKHGTTTSTTAIIAPGLPPLDCAGMVLAARRQHEILVACNCPYVTPTLNATVSYATSTGVIPGEQRISQEQSATVFGANFKFTGRLVCMRAGAYQVEAKIQLAAAVSAGAIGLGQCFVAGSPPMLSAPMTDEGGKATANLLGIVNLYPNQPLAVAYANTGTNNQDVTVTTLKVSEVWVP